MTKKKENPIESFVKSQNEKIKEAPSENTKNTKGGATFGNVRGEIIRLVYNNGLGYIIDESKQHLTLYLSDYPMPCAELSKDKYIINDEKLKEVLLQNEVFKAYYNINNNNTSE